MNNRPLLTMLRVLLVLSIIGSGMYCLSYLCLGALMPQMQQMLGSMQEMFPPEVMLVYERLFEIPRYVFLIMALLYALSLMGVIMMWRLRTPGLHSYTMAQILLLIVPLLFMGKSFVGLGDVMFTLLFVAMYWSLFRRLGILGAKPDNTPDNTHPQS